MWVVGTVPGSSARIASALNPRAISLALDFSWPHLGLLLMKGNSHSDRRFMIPMHCWPSFSDSFWHGYFCCLLHLTCEPEAQREKENQLGQQFVSMSPPC